MRISLRCGGHETQTKERQSGSGSMAKYGGTGWCLTPSYCVLTTTFVKRRVQEGCCTMAET